MCMLIRISLPQLKHWNAQAANGYKNATDDQQGFAVKNGKVYEQTIKGQLYVMNNG